MSLSALAERIGHVFDDESLLERALRHRSWCSEHGGAQSNERLEFLGDAVLGWAVADLAFRAFPDDAEGSLTAMRINVVQEAALAEIARGIDLGDELRLGRGEQNSGGRDKASILSDAFEAVIAAVYLDGGSEAAFAVVERLVGPHIAAPSTRSTHHDHKTDLQELCARLGHRPPTYSLSSTGPDHAKVFTAEVTVAGGVVGVGEGPNKKSAEQAAAAEACAALS